MRWLHAIVRKYISASGTNRFDLRGRNVANGIDRHVVIEIAAARVMSEQLP